MHIRIYVYASSTITTTFFFLWVTQRGSYFRHYPIFGMSWRPCHIDTLIPTSLLSWLYDILSCLLLTAWVSITPNSAQTTTVCSSYALLPRNTPTPRSRPPSPVPRPLSPKLRTGAGQTDPSRAWAAFGPSHRLPAAQPGAPEHRARGASTCARSLPGATGNRKQEADSR